MLEPAVLADVLAGYLWRWQAVRARHAPALGGVHVAWSGIDRSVAPASLVAARWDAGPALTMATIRAATRDAMQLRPYQPPPPGRLTLEQANRLIADGHDPGQLRRLFDLA